MTRNIPATLTNPCVEITDPTPEELEKAAHPNAKLGRPFSKGTPTKAAARMARLRARRKALKAMADKNARRIGNE